MTSIRLADSHAHLDLPEYEQDQLQVIQQALDNGVQLIINIGISVDNSAAALATAQQYDGIYAAVGVHPHGAGAMTENTLIELEKLAAHSKVVALGEIGLDFYRRRAPEEVQEHWFRRLLELAQSLQKPVIIHTREAMEATTSILQENRHRLQGGIMHCFSGSYEDARALLDLGLMISFSGVLTYPNARSLRETARQLPLERILIETDAPYLSPQPRRGKRNEPAHIIYTAQTLAEVMDVPLAEVAQKTWDNTRQVFGLAEEV
jgi:TatD DNase family protein